MSAAEPEMPDAIDPTQDVLDYEGVVDRCMGKHALANRLIGKFLDNLDDEVARIKSLLEEQNWAEATQAAHKVKGAAATLEAKQLRACLHRLELDLRQGVPVDVSVVTSELNRTSGDYRVAAEAVLQDRADAGRDEA